MNLAELTKAANELVLTGVPGNTPVLLGIDRSKIVPCDLISYDGTYIYLENE